MCDDLDHAFPIYSEFDSCNYLFWNLQLWWSCIVGVCKQPLAFLVEKIPQMEQMFLHSW